jgi:hypothetical protein
VIVHTNDPHNRVVTLKVKSLVRAEFAVSEEILDFGNAATPGRAKRLTISAAHQVTGRILGARSTERRVHVSLSNLGRGQYEVLATAVAADDDTPLFGNLIVSTSSSLMPEIRVPIRGQATGPTGRDQ